MSDLTVSKLAEKVGLTADTIRYYERESLLPPARRTAGGYRLYDDTITDRLRFIKGAQTLGLRLREIRELLDVLDRGMCPCGHSEAMLHQRLSEIDAEAARLRVLKREIVRALTAFEDRKSARDGQWPCESEFIRATSEKAGRNGA